MITLANGWKLRIRQEECHDKLIDSYNKGYKEFLLAANCRFGKTITTLQSLRDLANGDQAIVVISTMSVKKEWKEGAEAVGYDLGLLNKEINDIDFASLPESGQHIVYCSTQKLANGSAQSEALIKWFNRHDGLKSLVYDECHLGAGTDRTVEGILDRLAFDNKVYLSGTPYRRHLKEEFGLDLVEGEEKTYLYTIMDEREDYKDGVIDDYVPVQLEMHVLDYSEHIDSMAEAESKAGQKYGVSSAYFKKIFSDKAYEDKAVEFLGKIIEFAEDKNIRNFLFFVPLRTVGNDIVKHFGKRFASKIEFRNLCGEYSNEKLSEEEEKKLDESEAAALNEFYSADTGKIKIGITCNKCGTGTTIRGLDAVAFLKDTTQAIPFIQKSQRVRTPEDGKTVGYCLCFNQWQGLKAFCDYAKTASKNDADSEKDAVRKAIENGAVKLVLNLQEVKDYSEIIDVLNTYQPGRYPLFDEFDFSAWPEGTFAFLTDVASMKNTLLKKYPKLRDDPYFNEADTAKALEKALRNNGLDREADEVRAKAVTLEELRQGLEDNFVAMIGFFFDNGDPVETVLDTSSYDEGLWRVIGKMFGTKDVWEYILKTYPRYANMVYNYLQRN